MQQWYKCPKCDQDILYGSNPCPYCKWSLNWSQQGPALYIPLPESPQQQADQNIIVTKNAPITNISQNSNTFTDRDAAEVLMLAEGVNGQLSLLTDKIRIGRKGVLSFLTQGLKGNKEIYLSQISSIQLKRCDFVTNGYIQFAFLGGQESKQGLWDATKDENTIMFNKKQQAGFEAIKMQIDTQVSSLRNINRVVGQSHGIDDLERLASLRDKGIITEEEFIFKKKQILGM